MQRLTFNQVSQIQKLVESEQIGFSHLADDLIDHICCMIEDECGSGLSFDEAFQKIRLQIGDTRNIKKVEENTLLLIDKKYRIMKTTMKVFALISLIMIAFGSVFKMMHWPGAGIMFLLGFMLLALVFYPSAISVMKREYKIKGGGLIYPVALISGIALIIGILFKLQHYPGASILLLIGFFLFIFILIPAILISKTSIIQSKVLKWVNVIGAVSLVVILAGVCSKFFHWPGAAIELFVGSLMLSLIWLPLYAYYMFKESPFVKGGFIYLCIAIILFNLFNMLLALNVSRDVYKDYVQPSVTYIESTELIQQYNKTLINAMTTDSARDSAQVNKIARIHKSSSELVAFISNTKINLVALLDNIPKSDAKELSAKIYLLQNKFDSFIPTKILCGESGTGEDGTAYVIQLKIEAYRNLLLAEVKADNDETNFIMQLLSTSPVSIDENNQRASWVMYNFYNIPAIGSINALSGLEYKIVLAENSIISNLASARNETK